MNETVLFFLCVAAGLFARALFIPFRRAIKKSGAILTFIIDTVLAFLGGVPFAALIFIFNDGIMPYFAVAVAISFTLSGYYGLYSGQKFTYSKTKAEFINRKAH